MIDKLAFDGQTVYGKHFDRIFVHGQGPDIFLAVGCSWTRAWGAHDLCEPFGSDSFKDDPEFMLNKSYVGLTARHLGFDSIVNMAIPGSSMDMQSRFLFEFLQKNRHQFRRIFVLWGLTSHLRWELYSNKIDCPAAFQIGANPPKQAKSYYPGRNEEMKMFLTNHWNERFELERYNRMLVMTHAYLKMLDVNHLFFCTFQSFNQTNMNLTGINDCNFFFKSCHPNDVLSLWCQEHRASRPQMISSNPFSSEDRMMLSDLTDLGFLSKSFAHPTDKGHRDIADRLISYVDVFQ